MMFLTIQLISIRHILPREITDAPCRGKGEPKVEVTDNTLVLAEVGFDDY
jgi:hypothetical protein